MKKIILCLAACYAVMAANAQNLSLGPTAGFGHSWTDADKGALDRMFHPYFTIGGKLVYSFVTNWGISADVRFSSEGQTLGVDKDNKVVGRANYIRVPLQGIYFFGDYGQAVRPKISVGPSFGFLVGGETKIYQDGDVMDKGKTKDIAESFDFGLTGAVGVNFRIATATWLNADIAYYHGLTNILESGADAKNRNLGLNLGVTFPIGTVRPEKK